MKLGEFIGIVV